MTKRVALVIDEKVYFAVRRGESVDISSSDGGRVTKVKWLSKARSLAAMDGKIDDDVWVALSAALRVK